MEAQAGVERDRALLTHGAELQRMLNYTSWANRRVEQISFVDDQTVRRRVSFDFNLPATYADHPLDGWFAPLALLSKEKLFVGFDLRDEEGNTMPLVASGEANRIGRAILIATASSILETAGASLSREIAEDLDTVVRCEIEDAEEAMSRVLEPRRGRDDRRHLANDPLLSRMVDDFARNWLALAPIPDPAAHRVIKFSFLESLISGPRSSDSILRMLGWRKTTFRFSAWGASMAPSYHCEIAAPETLEIMRGRLLEIDHSGKTIQNAPSDQCGGRVHLRLTGVRSNSNTLLLADLRARRDLPAMAAVLGVGISLFLTVGLLFLDSILDKGGDTAALLVAIPALLAAYLAHPGEHRLAARLLLGIRWLTGLIGLLVFIAAAALATGKHHHDTVVWIWIVVTGLSWLATVALIASAILPRPYLQAPAAR